MKKEICFVTANKSKFHEVEDFISKREPRIQLIQKEMDLFEIQTRDQRAIALHKAQDAWSEVGQPLIVDDSAIYLEKYGNFPGTLTRHVFKGIGYKGLFRLVDSGDRATFILSLVYMDDRGRAHIFEGRQEGSILKPDRLEINADFPFDQIFIPSGTSLTYSQLKNERKDDYYKVGHRAAAVDKFLQWYQQQKK